MKNKVYSFREKGIKRTCVRSYGDYPNYKPHLKIDFHNRCAYCNLSADTITTSFEVDHFIPYKKFAKEAPELKCDYSNLVYSCKKCNIAKSNKHEGDKTSNDLFYNPVTEDLNIHFQRCRGEIIGLDKKAKRQIIEVKLYRPIHQLEWIVEKLTDQILKLQGRIEHNTDIENNSIYIELKCLLSDMYFQYENIFKACYNYSEQQDSQICYVTQATNINLVQKN